MLDCLLLCRPLSRSTCDFILERVFANRKHTTPQTGHPVNCHRRREVLGVQVVGILRKFSKTEALRDRAWRYSSRKSGQGRKTVMKRKAKEREAQSSDVLSVLGERAFPLQSNDWIASSLSSSTQRRPKCWRVDLPAQWPAHPALQPYIPRLPRWSWWPGLSHGYTSWSCLQLYSQESYGLGSEKCGHVQIEICAVWVAGHCR